MSLSNEVEEVDFTLRVREDCEEAKSSLRFWRKTGNKLSVTINLHYVRGHDIPNADTDPCGLFTELAQCEIVGFEINSMFQAPVRFSPSTIASVITNSRSTLESLAFRFLRFLPGLENLVAALQGLPILGGIGLQECCSVDQGESMGTLLTALGSCPELKCASISDITPEGSNIQTISDGLATLCGSNNLMRIDTSWKETHAGTVVAMFNAIRDNSNPSLKELNMYAQDHIPENGTRAICEVLRSNATIERLRISVRNKNLLAPVASAMVHNKTMVCLVIEVFHGRMELHEYLPFEEMLKNNYALHELHIDGRASPTISFYLKLNSAFRRKYWLDGGDSAARKDWIDAIMTNRQDTRLVYYLLSKNPNLCRLVESELPPTRAGGDANECDGPPVKRQKATA